MTSNVQSSSRPSLPVVDFSGYPQVRDLVGRSLANLKLQLSISDEWTPLGVRKSAFEDDWAEATKEDICAQVRWLIQQAEKPNGEVRPRIELEQTTRLGAVVLLPPEDLGTAREGGKGICEPMGAYYRELSKGSSLLERLMQDQQLSIAIAQAPSDNKYIAFPTVVMYPAQIKSFCSKSGLDFMKVARLVLVHEVGHHVFPLTDEQCDDYARGDEEVLADAEGRANLFAWMCSDAGERSMLEEKTQRQDVAYRVYKELLQWAFERYPDRTGQVWSPRVATLVGLAPLIAALHGDLEVAFDVVRISFDKFPLLLNVVAKSILMSISARESAEDALREVSICSERGEE